MKSYKARGIVLHTLKYGDSSLVVYMLTDRLGRQTFMVNGVRSARGHGNKLALFQPMFVLEFEGLELPRGQMHRFREVHAALPLHSLPFDVRKSTIALFMAEVLYRLIKEVEPESPLFGYVSSSVEALDGMEVGVANFHLWFLAGLSRFLGFFPGNEYLPGSWFDIREGLFTAIRPDHGIAMTREDSRLLDQMIRCDARSLSLLQLNRSQRVDFLNAMLLYFGYHLDSIHSVESIRILQEVF